MTIRIASEIIFWMSVLALCYTYAGYPLLVFVVSLIRSRKVLRKPNEPSVSVIITAYNEERDLRAKLENTLALEYPSSKLEVIVASDCSTDRTDQIVFEFASRGVRLHRQSERLGKTAAQNAAVEHARGEVILFSDATTLYNSDILRVMMPDFADPSIGCVAGRLVYIDPANSAVGHGARSYWSYETFLKKHESRTGSLIGASGCLYAVRRSAYIPMYHEACSDFLIATKMVEQGLRTVFEPSAVCTEETNRRAGKEMKMRVRVITQTFTDLWRHREMMNPWRSGFYAIQLFSHKVLRYFVPLFLIAMLAMSAILAPLSRFYAATLGAQLLFYAMAVGGWMLERTGARRMRLLALPQYFVLANLASVIACYKFLSGERYARWEPVRESKSSASSNVAAVGQPGRE
jgi:cellulose synthase/poly-beta-1,6-N-acetylglucosamine synthase-like glycosyltransferase